jgi:hypothetical protein
MRKVLVFLIDARAKLSTDCRQADRQVPAAIDIYPMFLLNFELHLAFASNGK